MGLYVLKFTFVVGILGPYFKLSGRGKSLFNRFWRQLFWGDLLALLLDACFEIFISSYLQLNYDPIINFAKDYSGDIAAKVTSYANLFWIFTILPASFVFLLMQPLRRLAEK